MIQCALASLMGNSHEFHHMSLFLWQWGVNCAVLPYIYFLHYFVILSIRSSIPKAVTCPASVTASFTRRRTGSVDVRRFISSAIFFESEHDMQRVNAMTTFKPDFSLKKLIIFDSAFSKRPPNELTHYTRQLALASAIFF